MPETAGEATPPALRRAAAAALTLPRFSPEVPIRHITTPSGEDVLTIAEVLLSQGLVKETDWDPNLGIVGSLQEGLNRWLQEQGYSRLQYLSLEWSFTDDVDLWGLNNSDWRQVDQDPATGEVGGFALIMHDSIDTLMLREGVYALEALAKGAGFSVLRALYSGLYATVGAWTPATAEDWLEEDWYQMRQEEQEENGLVTEELFHATLPKEAIHPEWKPRSISRAKKQLLGRDTAAVAFYLAEEIRKTLSDWEAYSGGVKHPALLNDACDFQTERVFPVVLRWSEDDEMMRVFDEMIHNCGEWTAALFLRCFLTRMPEQIEAALTHMTYATRIVSLCDSLIGHLDRRKELVHVFAQAEVQERVRIQV